MSERLKCEKCGASYKDWRPRGLTLDEKIPESWLNGSTPGETPGSIQLPSCECRSREYEKKRDEENMVKLGEPKFNRLGLGKLDEITRSPIPPIMQAWQYPEDAYSANLSLVLWGGVGSQKTSLLKKLAYYFCITGRKVRGGFVPCVLKDLKNPSSREDFLDWLLGGDVLFLDDLDKLLGTRYEIDTLLMVVDRYKAYEKPTFVTLNVQLSALANTVKESKYDIPEASVDSLVSRLHYKAVMVHSGNLDYRKIA